MWFRMEPSRSTDLSGASARAMLDQPYIGYEPIAFAFNSDHMVSCCILPEHSQMTRPVARYSGTKQSRG